MGEDLKSASCKGMVSSGNDLQCLWRGVDRVDDVGARYLPGISHSGWICRQDREAM